MAFLRSGHFQWWWGKNSGFLSRRLRLEFLEEENARHISIHPGDKSRLDTILRRKLALFGYHLPPAPGVGER